MGLVTGKYNSDERSVVVKSSNDGSVESALAPLAHLARLRGEVGSHRTQPSLPAKKRGGQRTYRALIAPPATPPAQLAHAVRRESVPTVPPSAMNPPAGRI